MPRTIQLAAICSILVTSTVAQAQEIALNCDDVKTAPGYKFFEPMSVGVAPGSAAVAAEQEARDAAVRKLAARLSPNGCGRDALLPFIQPWRTGHNSRVACAVAVIADSDYQQWQASMRDPKQFDAALVSFAEATANAIAAGRRKGFVPTVAVFDYGRFPEFQAWAVEKLRQALSKKSIIAAPNITAWLGGPVPIGLHALIVPKIFPTPDIVDISWELHVADGISGRPSIKVIPMSVPPCAGPKVVDQVTAAAPSSDAITLEVATPRGAAACEGDTIRFTAKSTDASPLYLRVYDLWGKDGAQLVYPAAPEDPGLIRPGATIALADESEISVLTTPNGIPFERFVAFSAKTSDMLESTLGRLSSQRRCRLPVGVASRLHRLSAPPPGTQWSWREVAILSGGKCPDPDIAMRDAARKALADLPECKL